MSATPLPAAPSSPPAAATRSPAPTTVRSTTPPEVPLFLQKAYHMIDTCDAEICGWADEGRTFAVKDTRRFETQVIPQFFKHNKFSSFVRQLNFYGFRKVKYSNSLKIDRQLDVATARYWKFRHDNFQRGRKDLLTEIRRTPSTLSRIVGPLPLAAPAADGRPGEVAFLAAEVRELKQKMASVTEDLTEVRELKQKIASMTVNIDELTDMVKKASVDDDADDPKTGGLSPVISSGNLAGLVESETPVPGNKRKKMDGQVPIKREEDSLPLISNWHQSSSQDATALPDWHPSSGHLAQVPLLLGIDRPLLEPVASAHLPAVASSSPLGDDEFVDDLFQAFAEDPVLFPSVDVAMEEGDAGPAPRDACQTRKLLPRKEEPLQMADVVNRPCPQLVRRIEDSLATLPRSLHEIVADRLVDAIAEARPLAATAGALLLPAAMPAAPAPAIAGEARAAAVAPPRVAAGVRDVAVAALRTLLAEYGSAAGPEDAAREQQRFTGSVPVVPVHA